MGAMASSGSRIADSAEPDEQPPTRLRLTDIERRILEVLCEPCIPDDGGPPTFAALPPTDPDIARALNIGRDTLRTHMKSIYKKVDLTSKKPGKRIPLVQRVYQWRLIGWARAPLAAGTPQPTLEPALGADPPTSSGSTRIAGLRCVGRDVQLDAIVAAVTADPPQPVAVLGAPGIGKTTVALAASLDRRLDGRFERHVAASCDRVEDRGGLIAALHRELADEVGPTETQVLAALCSALVILDAFEVPWRADAAEAERMLTRVAAVPGVALVCCLRGNDLPGRLSWREIELKPLCDDAAQAFFLDVVGERRRTDPGLEEIVGAMDGHPYAIEVMAARARHEPSLERLHRDWRKKGIRLLERDDDPRRGMVALLADAIHSDYVTERSRRLLTQIARLPDGVDHADLGALRTGGSKSRDKLHAAALVSYSGDRVHVHSLTRDYVLACMFAREDDLRQVVEHYCDLARQLGQRVGAPRWSDDRRTVLDEHDNIVWAIGEALKRPDPASGISATIALKSYAWFVPVSIKQLFEDALNVATDVVDRVDLRNAMGLTALARSRRGAAEHHFKRARKHARKLCRLGVGSERLATSVLGLAEVALRRFEHTKAGRLFKAADDLYRPDGARSLGVANCVLGLGQIALRAAELDEAQRRFDEARGIYAEVSDELGVANCVKGLGDVEWRRWVLERARGHLDAGREPDGACERLDEARRQLESALKMYGEIRHALGEANARRDLGELALGRGDLEGAEEQLAYALTLFEDLRNPLGQANCLAALGDVALARRDADAALASFTQALPRYAHARCAVGHADCKDRLSAIKRDDDGALNDLPPRAWTPDDNA